MARFFSGVPHPHLLGDRCPNHSCDRFVRFSVPIGTYHASPVCRPNWPLRMFSHDPIFFSQLVTSFLAICSLGVVLKLWRLKWAEIRKQRQMARAGEQFGLIQAVVATGRPRTANPPFISSKSRTNSSPVQSMDTNVKRWTSPSPNGSTPFQWN